MTNVVAFPFIFLLLCVFISSITTSRSEVSMTNEAQPFSYHIKVLEFIWTHLGYQHVWPEMDFGWRIVVGTLIGIFGAVFGSVGGVGGGGIFLPMLILIIGFDPKSAIAISKCMVTGAAISTVFFCLKQKHPTLDQPVIDYDLMLLIQPMLMLGISIGVILSVIFADWMVTVLLIILCIVTSIRAFFKGADTWKKETKVKGVNATNFTLFRRLSSFQSLQLVSLCISSSHIKTSHGHKTKGFEEEGYKYLPSSPDEGPEMETRKPEVGIHCIVGNIYWKEFVLIFCVWLAYVNYTVPCSVTYWILILSQIPISVGFYLYQARALYQGGSAGVQHTHWPLHHLFLASISSLLAGIVGGLLGTGSGFVMGPLFLEVGLAPQVASATATFGMMYSSSLSVIQYYLLNRFPVPYGGVGLSNMILKIQRNEYMGFENFCT
uniref:Sulfite exporter TauE/SafE family protein 3 n=1 Tax=Cajanus cajan TaxID=3821 RepID=A0A151SFM2_CAJCA|nr:hypothetical protein KK1_024481 [Cajanus cajan]